MEGIQGGLGRLREAWGGLSFNQRAIVGLIAGATVLSALIFSVWLRSDSMVVLYSGLGPEDASQAVELLGQRGVKTELRAGGSTILVPSQDVDRMRMELAVEGVGSDGIRGWDLFDEGGLGETDFTLNVKLKRALEGELSRSITSIDQVQAARVHINSPRQSLFVRDQRPATASVVLTLRGRNTPGREQIEGVQNLVASAVDGLDASQVTIVDASSGRTLGGASSSDATGMSSEQLRVRKEVEDHLASKASDILADVLGPGGFVVRVNADLDFEQLERTAQTFDPKTVVRSEQSDESTDPDGAGSTNSITNYEVSNSVETVLRNGTLLRKLSVAVAIDGVHGQGEDGSPTYAPRSAEELDQLRRVVAGAVGLDPGRGDQIEVVNMPFDNTVPVETPLLESPLVQQLPSMVGRLLLFVVAAVLLLGLRKNVAQMLNGGDAAPPLARARGPRAAGANGTGRAATAAAAGGAAYDSYEREVDELENIARGNPDEIADLVMAFASQED